MISVGGLPPVLAQMGAIGAPAEGPGKRGAWGYAGPAPGLGVSPTGNLPDRQAWGPPYIGRARVAGFRYAQGMKQHALRGGLAVILGLVLVAASGPRADAAPARDDKDKLAPPPAVTTGSVATRAPGPAVGAGKAGGGEETIAYRATAGVLPLLDEKLKPKAQVFYVAYERLENGEPMPAGSRPITFAFNGGPGSSSVWLHLGALGPVRVKMGPEGEVVKAAGELVPNDATWLRFTDLVFIDPVSTGYSRAEDDQDPKQFHGLDEDARAVGDFIRLYLTRAQRWQSPKYLTGESYGTTRASVLAADIQSRLGVFLDGVVLVSPILQFQTTSFEVGNDVVYPLYLPSYTATAWHHKKLSGPLAADLSAAVAASEVFARTEYTLALMEGSDLAPARRDAVAQRLSELTGLSKAYILLCDLRPTLGQFTKELLRDRGLTVGRLDSRYTGVDRSAVRETPEYDPSYAAIQGHYTAALNTYVRGTLKFESDLNYEILTGNVHPWNYPQRNRYANVAESLRSAMSFNPNLRVLALSGHYDFATPQYAMRYTIAHMGLSAAQRARISQVFYASGHMMYVRDADRIKVYDDVAAFYAGGQPDERR